MDKIPLYNIVVNLDDDSEYMSAISFVESPAVEYQFITFDKEKPQLKFSVDNELEHKVTSVVCLCDVPIYRYSPDMGEFYVKFDKTAIDNMIYKYSKLGLQNMVNLQHDENNFVDGCTMVEMYQVNRAKGIVHKDFPDVPDYSLMATFKIENEEVWNDIITGKCNGYSLELYSTIEPTNTFIELNNIEVPMSEEDYLNSLVNELLKDFDVDILFDSKKKIDIDKIIDDNLQVEIKVNNTSKIIKGWVYTEYVVNGSKNLAIWDNRTWHTVNENNIDIIKVVDTKILPNWNNALKHPDFNNIHNTVKEADGVQKKADTPQNFWEDIIMNKKIVLLKYDDESGEGCTTYRQCLVCEYGYTTAGNACLRAYQYTGATHTGDINPLASWRNFLIKRLIDIKVAPGIFEPIDVPPPGFNPNADKDGFVATIKAKFNTDEEKSNGN